MKYSYFMESFGALATKSQFILLNNLNHIKLYNICKRRGINIDGFIRRYDLIILFIQWYNNIQYLEYTSQINYQKRIVRGFICSEKGPRKHMEDDYIIYFQNNISIFGVFDGHGGNYVSNHLREYIKSHLIPRISGKGGINKDNITKGFLDIDREFYNRWTHNIFGTDGSTASIVIGDKNILHFINLGDSRTVLYNDNSVVFSTSDHKPMRSKELERIRHTRYDVVMKDVARIGGLLALSRSFGDFIYKIDEKEKYRPVDYAVSTVPDITSIDIHSIPGDTKRIISATDGLWDAFTNEEVGHFVSDGIKRGYKHKTIMRNLINMAYERGSTDNITVVLVEL